MSAWRKVHRYSFGYFRGVSAAVAALMVLVAVSGIVYNHHRQWDWVQKGRIPTALLPHKYRERLDTTRRAQGLEQMFPSEAGSVPVMWVVADLHTGDFFGPWGRLAYDAVAVMFVVLSVTGIYLYLRVEPGPRSRAGSKRPPAPRGDRHP